MPYPLLILFLLLLVAALLAWWLAARAQRASGLPAGEVIYADTGAWEKVEKPLVDREHGLVGRPDYLVRTRAGIIPVEVKSGARPATPYASHLLQLAAYCLLVEATSGRAPRWGYLHYDDATLRIPYTSALRAQLLDVLESIRADRQAQEVDRSHDDPARCRGCGFRHACNQRLP
ncbi:MAG: Dna2/Cas4 domain-containing protein [Anaerolineae bacterium]|nr:Dna2/Cas4 domain-containing protein [Anaerolineae bacterium]